MLPIEADRRGFHAGMHEEIVAAFKAQRRLAHEGHVVRGDVLEKGAAQAWQS